MMCTVKGPVSLLSLHGLLNDYRPNFNMTKEANLSIEIDAADSDTLFDFRSFKITFTDELKVLETEQIEL